MPLDVTQVLAWTKRTGSSFFLTVLYAAARAASAVPELRRRVRGEAVVEYDRCPTSHTVALPDGSDCYCRLDAVLPGAGTGTCTSPKDVSRRREKRAKTAKRETRFFTGSPVFWRFQKRGGLTGNFCPGPYSGLPVFLPAPFPR